MPGRPSSDPKVGVITEHSAIAGFDQTVFADGVYVPAAPDETKVASLGRLLDQEVDVVAVVGDDRLVADVLSTHRRHFRTHPTPLRLFVMRAGQFTRVADALDAPALEPKTFRRLKSALLAGNLNRRLLPTLKVTSSAQPSAQLGFSFGAGLFYRLFEAYHRAGASTVGAVSSTLGRIAREMLLESTSALEPVKARVAVDGRPRADSIGFLLASSLKHSWLGLHLLEERDISFRMGNSSAELIREVAKARALPRFLRSDSGAEAFERIHIDWTGGYVLDGELYEPSMPYVVQVKEGPVAHFVTL
ncbi:hypothetical protein FIV42_03050 [Persicimonas caeni]|uniref:DAGKc domain-containing protein n=1 Tax=Persicimonas caeni TaxID=2292766 RepID=A0A4Y6PN59_PERCE|nr:hypothetical protein [Persicimonas caeni]QDG49748.1 hypothetical protein FIV42_03050 [Persicimonas caeni]QED30969.1 hypothetical protein FRD00_03045 [Persicimonas caeni]